MKHMITSRPGKQGRGLVVVALALVALALLLGVGNSWPAAEAQALANLHNPDLSPPSKTALGPKKYLAFVTKSNTVFVDDFSSTSSGWPHKVSFEDCYYEYRDGHYRVEVNGNGQRCIVPNLKIPKQVNGTFSVRMRRTSPEDRHLLYGLIFGAGTDANEDRWAVEMYPNNDSDCDNKPFYWLYALVGGDRDYFKDRCTNSIDNDEDDWNQLKIIRNGSNIRVIVTGESTDQRDYTGANYLLNQGFTLLEVVSASDDEIVVEFDDLKILKTTN
jgi:hypothetical protein